MKFQFRNLVIRNHFQFLSCLVTLYSSYVIQVYIYLTEYETKAYCFRYNSWKLNFRLELVLVRFFKLVSIYKLCKFLVRIIKCVLIKMKWFCTFFLLFFLGQMTTVTLLVLIEENKFFFQLKFFLKLFRNLFQSSWPVTESVRVVVWFYFWTHALL